ncbi:hypothetical protein GC197_07030 [bacterium]|nr:hypothetical protein [bacterium]
MKRSLIAWCLVVAGLIALPATVHAVGFHTGGIAGGYHPGGMGGGFQTPGPIGGTGFNLPSGGNFEGAGLGGMASGINTGDFGGGNLGGARMPNGGVSLPSNDVRPPGGGDNFPNILPQRGAYDGYQYDHGSMPVLAPHYPSHRGPASGDIQSFEGLHRGNVPLANDHVWTQHAPDVANKVQGRLGQVLGPDSGGAAMMNDWLDNNTHNFNRLKNWSGEAQRLGYNGGQMWGDYPDSGRIQSQPPLNRPQPTSGALPSSSNINQNIPNLPSQAPNAISGGKPGNDFWGNGQPILPGNVQNFQKKSNQQFGQWWNTHPQVQQKIQDHFDPSQSGSASWKRNHPNLKPWYYQNDWSKHDRWYWWADSSWGQVTGWFPSAWNWAGPIFYAYGPDGNIVYQKNAVYVNGQQVGTQAEYAQSAAQLADVGTASINDAGQQEFLPLGTFSISTSEQDPSPNRVIQLAVDREGIISGTYYNTSTDKTYLVQGRVDKTSQRCAFTIGDNTGTVFETGIYNLTKDEAPVLVHFGTTRTEHYLLIRMHPPKDAVNQDGDSSSNASPGTGLPF